MNKKSLDPAGHLTLAVSNLEKSRMFYKALFGELNEKNYCSLNFMSIYGVSRKKALLAIVLLLLIIALFFAYNFRKNRVAPISFSCKKKNVLNLAKENTPPKFFFGLEYIFLGEAHKIADCYSEIGATWTKTAPSGTLWQDLEPKPSANGVHNYNWSKVDEVVKAMQSAGFLNLTIELGPRSNWGSKPIPRGEGLHRFISAEVNTAPKDEYLNDYALYVENFVERYDRDGVNDMPGLLAPITHYEVLSEAQWTPARSPYWRGTVDEYIKVLKISYAAAKRASPDTKIILSGFAFWDLFDGGPLSDKQIALKIQERADFYPSEDPRQGAAYDFVNPLAFNERILREKDYFDEVELHLLSNYTGIEGAVDWLRRQMRKNGYEKPIWVGDAGASPQIPSHNRVGRLAVFNTFNLFYPPLYDDGDKIFEVLTSKKDKYGYAYEKVREWAYKEQSNYLAKSLIIEMELGLAGTNIFTWLDGSPAFWLPGAFKNWQIQGLRQGNLQSLQVGEPKPAFYTYKMIIQKLGRFSKVEKVNLENKQIKAYKFMVEKKLIYVLWYDDGLNQKPGEKETEIKFDFKTDLNRVKISPVITEIGQTESKTKIKEAKNGAVSLTLSATPVFAEGE